MPYKTLILVLSILTVSIVSGNAGQSDQDAMSAARALFYRAENCYYDVRDRGFTYEKSTSCLALPRVHKAFVELGGFQDGRLPIDVALMGERARSTAWMARAISSSGNPNITIW